MSISYAESSLLWLPERSTSYVMAGFTGQGQHDEEMFMAWYGFSPKTDEQLACFHDQTNTRYGKPLPAEALKAGPLMQPANTTLGVIGSTALENAGVIPNEALGHSLGEIAAAVCAGALEPEPAIRLARARGVCTDMNIQDLIDKGIFTGMMAVKSRTGRAASELADLLRAHRISPDDLYISNYNTPDQAVLSGTTEMLDFVKANLSAGKKGIRLAVDGAYHSVHMRLARNAFKEHVDRTPIQVPTKTKLYSPTTVSELKTRDMVAEMLYNQLVKPVRYEELIRNRIAYLNRDGIRRLIRKGGAEEIVFVEIGAYGPNKPTTSGVLIGITQNNVGAYQRGDMPIRYHRISTPEDIFHVR